MLQGLDYHRMGLLVSCPKVDPKYLQIYIAVYRPIYTKLYKNFHMNHRTHTHTNKTKLSIRTILFITS